MKRRLTTILFILGTTVLFNVFVWADDSLSQWADSLSNPLTQYKILQKIFPEGLAPFASGVLDPNQETTLFQNKTTWAQLTKEFVWIPEASSAAQPMLMVTELTRPSKDGAPINATSYLFRDTAQKPFPISIGYGNREHLRQITPPKLNQSLLLVETISLTPQGKVINETATVYQINPAQAENPLHDVWESRPSTRYFHIGFAMVHDSGGEDLILKESPPPPQKTEGSTLGDLWGDSADIQSPRYSAYRWSDGHFVLDEDVFDSRFKALPDTTWQY